MEDNNDPVLDSLNDPDMDHGQFVISVAQGFQYYMDDITDNCRYDNVLYLANYWHVMSIFVIYMKAQRTGETVLMEKMVENNFCNIFSLLEKHHYVELCLDQMDTKYNNIDSKSLHESCMNICCRYHNRYNNAFHILDEVMENVNMWMKALPIRADVESWSSHSANIVLAKHCNHFVKVQYRRSKVDSELSNVESGYQDDRNASLEVKRSIKPCYQREKARLFELVIMGCESNHSNRFISKRWIDNIEKLSVN